MREAADWCVRMADGDLTEAEDGEFNAWCDRDERNVVAFEVVARAWDAVGRAAAAPTMLGLRRAALDDLHRASAFRWRRKPALRWFALAASVVLAVALAFGVMNTLPRTYNTGLGERRVITLADGSKVSMDGATQVRVLYAKGRRQFWLKSGRAKFNVAKDPVRPFTVTAGGQMVVATGTQFSVELLRNQVRVALYEGHVTVWRASQKPGALQPIMAGDKVAEQVLTPGRELVAATNSASGQVVDSDPVRSLSWEAGELIFQNESLASAVERINRYAERPLRVTEGAGRDIRISGVFSAGDTEGFVQGVVSLFPLRVVRSGDDVTLAVDQARIAAKPKEPAPQG